MSTNQNKSSQFEANTKNNDNQAKSFFQCSNIPQYELKKIQMMKYMAANNSNNQHLPFEKYEKHKNPLLISSNFRQKKLTNHLSLEKIQNLYSTQYSHQKSLEQLKNKYNINGQPFNKKQQSFLIENNIQENKSYLKQFKNLNAIKQQKLINQNDNKINKNQTEINFKSKIKEQSNQKQISQKQQIYQKNNKILIPSKISQQLFSDILNNYEYQQKNIKQVDSSDVNKFQFNEKNNFNPFINKQSHFQRFSTSKQQNDNQDIKNQVQKSFSNPISLNPSRLYRVAQVYHEHKQTINYIDKLSKDKQTNSKAKQQKQKIQKQQKQTIKQSIIQKQKKISSQKHIFPSDDDEYSPNEGKKHKKTHRIGKNIKKKSNNQMKNSMNQSMSNISVNYKSQNINSSYKTKKQKSKKSLQQQHNIDKMNMQQLRNFIKKQKQQHQAQANNQSNQQNSISHTKNNQIRLNIRSQLIRRSRKSQITTNNAHKKYINCLKNLFFQGLSPQQIKQFTQKYIRLKSNRQFFFIILVYVKYRFSEQMSNAVRVGFQKQMRQRMKQYQMQIYKCKNFLEKNFRYQQIHQIDIALRAIQLFYNGETQKAIDLVYRKDKHIIVKQNHFRASLKFINDLEETFSKCTQEKITKPFYKEHYHNRIINRHSVHYQNIQQNQNNQNKYDRSDNYINQIQNKQISSESQQKMQQEYNQNSFQQSIKNNQLKNINQQINKEQNQKLKTNNLINNSNHNINEVKIQEGQIIQFLYQKQVNQVSNANYSSFNKNQLNFDQNYNNYQNKLNFPNQNNNNQHSYQKILMNPYLAQMQMNLRFDIFDIKPLNLYDRFKFQTQKLFQPFKRFIKTKINQNVQNKVYDNKITDSLNPQKLLKLRNNIKNKNDNKNDNIYMNKDINFNKNNLSKNVYPPLPPFFYSPQFHSKCGDLFRKKQYLNQLQRIQEQIIMNSLNNKNTTNHNNIHENINMQKNNIQLIQNRIQFQQQNLNNMIIEQQQKSNNQNKSQSSPLFKIYYHPIDKVNN